MNSFYSIDELKNIGFKKIGTNVLISKKSSIYGENLIEIGNNVRIDDFCILSGHIVLGNYIHIAAYSALYGGNEGVYLDDYVNISSRVTVYSISDDYSGMTLTNPMIPKQYKNVTEKPVSIGKHVIIGATSIVMPGVILGEGSAFGAFSFITKDSEPWYIYMGIPCVKKKKRKKDLLELEKNLKEKVSAIELTRSKEGMLNRWVNAIKLFLLPLP